MPTTKATRIVNTDCDSHVRAQGSEASSAVKASRKLRVLLVEDNAADGELMLHALRYGGFESESEVVQTPEEFTDRVRKNKYEIILADYSLPGWNGMETVAILEQEGLDIPVVLVSGPWES